MDCKKIINELPYRFKYYNWFIKATLDENNRIILHIAKDVFYEKHIVEKIMSYYDCKYEVIIVTKQ